MERPRPRSRARSWSGAMGTVQRPSIRNTCGCSKRASRPAASSSSTPRWRQRSGSDQRGRRHLSFSKSAVRRPRRCGRAPSRRMRPRIPDSTNQLEGPAARAGGRGSDASLNRQLDIHRGLFVAPFLTPFDGFLGANLLGFVDFLDQIFRCLYSGYSSTSPVSRRLVFPLESRWGGSRHKQRWRFALVLLRRVSWGHLRWGA